MKRVTFLTTLLVTLGPLAACHPPDRETSDPAAAAAARAATQDPIDRPAAAAPFEAFPERVAVRWGPDHVYVDSHGLPDHPMMVGITAWQQQVPIPQDYTGPNAWRIPRHPVPAANPLSAKDNFFRGAIALAANGVPIFNPIKNDGKTDTLLAGELDEFGGHAGRGDDYHYHVAPLHLQEVLGPRQPVAYALDGYPVFGRQKDFCPLEHDPGVELDAFNGHAAPDRPDTYHYHATDRYPYVNGGMHGEVTVRDGQIDPQPRSESPRPFTRPLRGATITGFETRGDQRWALSYTLGGQTYRLQWGIEPDGALSVQTDSPNGTIDRRTWPKHERPR